MSWAIFFQYFYNQEAVSPARACEKKKVPVTQKNKAATCPAGNSPSFTTNFHAHAAGTTMNISPRIASCFRTPAILQVFAIRIVHFVHAAVLLIPVVVSCA